MKFLVAVDPAVYDEGGTEPLSTLSDAEQCLVIESIEDAEDRGQSILEETAALAEELVEGEPSSPWPRPVSTGGAGRVPRGRSEDVVFRDDETPSASRTT
jgi:hypothetical protein